MADNMVYSIASKQLGQTITLAHPFTEDAAHKLMREEYKDVCDYVFRYEESPVNQSQYWPD